MACLRCFGFGDTCSVGVNSLLLSTLAAKLPGGLSLQEIKNVTQRSLHISCLFQLFLDLSAWHIADRISRKQWKNPKNRSYLPAFITGTRQLIRLMNSTCFLPLGRMCSVPVFLPVRDHFHGFYQPIVALRWQKISSYFRLESYQSKVQGKAYVMWLFYNQPHAWYYVHVKRFILKKKVHSLFMIKVSVRKP